MLEDFTISSCKVTFEIVEVIFLEYISIKYCGLKLCGPLSLFSKPTASCYTQKCRELNKLGYSAAAS